MFWIGVFSAIMSAATFIADFCFYMKEDISASRHAGKEAILWFIAMCICFK